MRSLVLTSATLFGLACMPALAQNGIEPESGPNEGVRGFLRDADRALTMHDTGAAKQALDKAQAKLSAGTAPAGAVGQPSRPLLAPRVADAQRALAAGDVGKAQGAIKMALSGAPAGDEKGEH